MSASDEPVIIQSIVTILAAVATPLLIKVGFTADGAASLFGALGALATSVLTIWSVAHARSKVTPVVIPSIGTTAPPPPEAP